MTEPIYPAWPVTSIRCLESDNSYPFNIPVRRSSGPKLPRCSLAIPRLIENLHFPIGIHALPETCVPINRELTMVRQLGQEPGLKGRLVTVDPVQHLRFKDEEATVNPSFLYLGLLLENL